MSMRHLGLAGALVALALACPGTAAAKTAGTLEVTAFDFGFSGITSGAVLDAGKYNVELTNTGTAFHEFAILGLSPKGAAASDAELLDAADAFDDSYLTRFVGGAFAPPGGTSDDGGKSKKAKLAAGPYAYFCFVRAPDGTPHYRLGMFGRLTAE